LPFRVLGKGQFDTFLNLLEDTVLQVLYPFIALFPERELLVLIALLQPNEDVACMAVGVDKIVVDKHLVEGFESQVSDLLVLWFPLAVQESLQWDA
jgi:hypothetical protein